MLDIGDDEFYFVEQQKFIENNERQSLDTIELEVFW